MPLEQFEDFPCPYCGEMNALGVDVSGGPRQEFVVDCEVCCAPISVKLKVQGGRVEWLDVQKENE